MKTIEHLSSLLKSKLTVIEAILLCYLEDLRTTVPFVRFIIDLCFHLFIFLDPMSRLMMVFCILISHLLKDIAKCYLKIHILPLIVVSCLRSSMPDGAIGYLALLPLLCRWTPPVELFMNKKRRHHNLKHILQKI